MTPRLRELPVEAICYGGAALAAVAVNAATRPAGVTWSEFSFAELSELCIADTVATAAIATSILALERSVWRSVASRCIRIAGILFSAAAVSAIYYAGTIEAVEVAKSLGDGPVAAFVSSPYSWMFVGWELGDWVRGHWDQPIGASVAGFWAML